MLCNKTLIKLIELCIIIYCLCQFIVFTKLSTARGTKEKLGNLGMMIVVSPCVGEIAIEKTMKHKMIIIPVGLNKIAATPIRIFSPRWAIFIYAQIDK